MRPVLLSLEVAGREVVLLAYPTMLVLAGIAALAVGVLAAGLFGLPRGRTGLALAAALAGALAGARLLHAATNIDLYAAEPGRLWAADATGFALYGGLLVGGPAGLAAARALGLPLWSFVDAAAPAAAVGVVFNRVGCFLQGCCHGHPTDLPWGIEFPSGSPAWVRQMLEGPGDPAAGGGALVSSLLGGGEAPQPGPVHPTQLYELAAALAALAIVFVVARRGARPGTAFLTAALWFTAFRALNAQLRWAPSTLTAPRWFYPLLYALLVAGLASLAIRRAARREEEPIPASRDGRHPAATERRTVAAP